MGQLVFVAGKAGIPAKDIATFTKKMTDSGLESFRDIRAQSAAKATKVAPKADAPKADAGKADAPKAEAETPQAEGHPLANMPPAQILALTLTAVGSMNAPDLRRVAKAIEARTAIITGKKAA